MVDLTSNYPNSNPKKTTTNKKSFQIQTSQFDVHRKDKRGVEVDLSCKALTRVALSKYNKYIVNFHALEVVSRYRDTQLQVGENNSYLFNLKPNSLIPKDPFHSEYQ